MNHAMYREDNGDGKNPPWDLDGDGKLSLEEANNWYRNGKGKSITVDASKVDLNFVDTSGWKKGQIEGIQTLFKSRNGNVLGNITVKYLGNNRVSILPDIYDFDMHKGSGVKTFIRNMATKIGEAVAGKGQAYKINFRGVNTIKYSKPIQVITIPRYVY